MYMWISGLRNIVLKVNGCYFRLFLFGSILLRGYLDNLECVYIVFERLWK